MRRRLLNQTVGDPAAAAIAAREAQLIGDVQRFPRLQPEIVSRRDRERVTETVRESNGGAGGFQGRSGMSQRVEALPPSPPAPIKRGPGRPRKQADG